MDSWLHIDPSGQRWTVTWFDVGTVVECDEHRAEIFCVTDDDQIVLVNSSSGGCNCPGGHVEDGESAADAAKREAREEASVDVITLLPIGVVISECVAGNQTGWRLRHDIFVGRVRLLDWNPPTDETHGRELHTWANAERRWINSRPPGLEEYARRSFSLARAAAMSLLSA